MTTGLILAFLFFAGSLLGWCLEFGFRNLVTHNGPKLGFVINPGFCRGPYLPIYGVGICVMFLISIFLTPEKGIAPVWLIVLGIGVCMSLIEFIGGWFLHKKLNIRLWDYSTYWGNIKGYICPKYSLLWLVLGALYYLIVHPMAIDGLIWLSHNLAFSFFIGLFFGFFIIDFTLSNRDAMLIKEFGDDNEIVIQYEELKTMIQKKRLENALKASFFNQISLKDGELKEILKEHFKEALKKEESIKEHIEEHIKDRFDI